MSIDYKPRESALFKHIIETTSTRTDVMKLSKAQFYLAYMLYCDREGQNCDAWDRRSAWSYYQRHGDVDPDKSVLSGMLEACKEEDIDMAELACTRSDVSHA